jgi:hypothetical protein
MHIDLDLEAAKVVEQVVDLLLEGAYMRRHLPEPARASSAMVCDAILLDMLTHPTP